MIRYSDGDIFSAGCAAIANPVNCVGVMGAGLAKEVRRRFPEACEPYFEACSESILRPGGLVVGTAEFAGSVRLPRFVFHVATKRHWRQPSRLADVAYCLDALASTALAMQVKSVAVPALGCGLGRLNWEDVHALMRGYLGETKPVEWVVFPPKGL